MNRVYIKKGKPNKGAKGYPWILSGAYDYLVKEAISDNTQEIPDWKEFVNSHKIEVDHNGKPYFIAGDIHFSLSHSGSYWVLLVSRDPCGIDVQRIEEKRDIEKIAKRFYREEEQQRELFYDVWTRREAFGKMTGEGFFGDMPLFVKNEEPISQVEYRGQSYNLMDLDLDRKGTFAEEYRCVACIKSHGSNGEIELVPEGDWPIRSTREKQKDIYTVASRWLSYRDRTEKELRDYLGKQDFQPEEIENTIREFLDFGYLDDGRYAEKFVSHGMSKGWGHLRIKRELAKKGVDFEIIEDYLAPEGELERALEIADKILTDRDYDEKGRLLEKSKARISRRLYSYGYPTDVIYRVIDRKNSDNN